MRDPLKPSDNAKWLIRFFTGSLYNNMNDTARAQNVSVHDVIKQRSSIGQMTDEQPSREQIEQLLEAATYVPNHHVTEPWHFFVLTGAARAELGNVMAESLLS